MLSRRFFIAVAVACLTLLPASATILPVPDLDKLVSTSNLIVVGELLAIERGPRTTITTNGAQMKVGIDQFVVRIDEVITGSAGSPVRVQVLSQNEETWQLPPIEIYGLFFLRKDDSGKLSMPDTNYGL